MSVKKLFGLAWRPVLAYSGALCAFAVLLFFRLQSLTPGVSQAEVVQTKFTGDFHHLIDSPLFLPHTSLEWLLHKVDLVNPYTIRFISALFGLAILIFYYMLLRHWFSMRVSIIGTTLFATSSWFLHTARLGLPNILLMSLVVFVLAAIQLKHSSRPRLALLFMLLAGNLLLYIPGMIWFLLAAIIWQRRRISREIRSFGFVSIALAVLVTAAMLSPLVWALIHQSNLWISWLGLPRQVADFGDLMHNFFVIPVHLLVRGPADPVMWLGRVPILDVFTAAMVILGLYTYLLHLRLDQAYLIGGILVIGVILVALGGPVTLAVLLPWIYVIATTGLAYLWQEWLSVFPRNPFARGIGHGLLIAAVITACSYQLLHYFVAWPHATQTKQVFSYRLRK